MNLIIAIAGPPGSGKSTLVTELAERLGQACSISCDDYQTITDKPIEDIAEWFADVVVWFKNPNIDPELYPDVGFYIGFDFHSIVITHIV